MCEWGRSGRVILTIAVALTTVSADALFSQGQQTAGGRRTEMLDGREVVEGEVIVRYVSQTGTIERERAEFYAYSDEAETIGRAGTRRLRSRTLSTSQMLATLRANPDVAYAEPNYIVRALATPNDPSFGSLWGLLNTGQVVEGQTGVPGADIGAVPAWDRTTGSRANVVAILDSGIAYNHPDLAANVFSAPRQFSVTMGTLTVTCSAGTHGFDAIANTCVPFDENGHGTHVAGIIGAVGNNNVGVTGVNWTANVMALKVLAADGTGTTADVVKAINWAIKAKAALGADANIRILNASWGGPVFSQSLNDEIAAANNADMLFVAAAGSSGTNNDSAPHYPASSTHSNVVSVAAFDNTGKLASYSNYGATSVDLAAPGDATLSTLPNNAYGELGGTSMSAAFVSGAATLALSLCPSNTATLKSRLLAGVDPHPSLSGVTVSGGRLNIANVLEDCGPPLPSVTPTSLTVAASGTITVNVADGPGHVADWVALHCPASAADGTYVDWKYLNNSKTLPATGLTTATITFTAPATGTTCDARLFASGGMSKLATSATITVTVTATTTVTPTSQNVAASGTITLNVADGPGHVADWVALHCPASAADGTYVDWKYLNNSKTLPATGLTAATITFTAPATGTTCNARLFASGGMSKLATSATITVTVTVTPTVTPTSQTVAPSGTITLNVADGPGHVADWVGLYCPASAADGAYSDWKYLNNSKTQPATGLTSATITFTAPATGTTCNARLFASGGLSKLATSATITVSP